MISTSFSNLNAPDKAIHMSIRTTNKKNRLNFVILCLLLGLSLFAIRTTNAQSELSAAIAIPTTAPSTIERLMALPNGAVFVRLKNVPVLNPRRCGNAYWYALVNNGNPEGMSRMLAMLLTARASEIQIRLGISDSECVGSTPMVVSVLVEPF